MTTLSFKSLSLLSLLSLLYSTVVLAQEAGSQNGACTSNICTCQMMYSSSDSPEFKPPECPEWMGVIYSSLESSACSPASGTGLRTCSGILHPGGIFENTPISSQNLTSKDGDNGPFCFVDGWTIRDGTEGVTLVNYNMEDPPPPCELEIPFSIAPSASPSAVFTATPTSTSSSGNSYSGSFLRWSSIATTGVAIVFTAVDTF